MLAEEKNRRQGALEKYIYELCEQLLDDSGIRNISLKLLEIYKGDFRHNYSSFFQLNIEISKDNNKYNLDYLSNNLQNIRSYIEEDFISGTKEFESIYGPLNKLCDNINLEIGRWNYYSQYEQKIEDIKSQSTFLNTSIASATKELKQASKQAATIQTELIAVLSIFAAIVITFSGGFTFLGSVMTSINDVDCYEVVVLSAIICGMVIFNTIFLLMYLVGKVTDRNIYAKCNSIDCSCKNRCGGITKIRKRLPYVFWFNVTCVIGIFIDCIVWYCDMRNWFGL